MADYSKSLALLDEPDAAPQKKADYSKSLALLNDNTPVKDDTSDPIREALRIKGPMAAIKGIPQDMREDLKKLSTIGTGVLQGIENVGAGEAQIPNKIIGGINYLTNAGIKKLPTPGAVDLSMTDYQKSANQENPMLQMGSQIVGSGAAMSPMVGGSGALGVMGTSGLAGTAASQSPDLSDALKEGSLSALTGGLLHGAGNAVQGFKKAITGTKIDPEVAAAANDVGMEKLPHVLLTNDDGLKNELTNSILPGIGNEAHRNLARANKNEFDQKANDFISDFKVTTPEGKELVGKNGQAPTQTEVKENVEKKINDTFNANKQRVSDKYLAMDEEAANTGAHVDVNGYKEKLDSIINHQAGKGKRAPDAVVSFAKDEMQGLHSQGALSKTTTGTDKSLVATGAYKPSETIKGKGVSFSQATDMKEELNKAIKDSTDPSERRHLISLKSSLVGDINKSVDESGNDKLMGLWKDAEQDYASSVAPFRSHSGLSKHLDERGEKKASVDNILGSFVKNDNPTDINEATKLVPGIKDDLAFLKIRSAADTFNKKNNPDVNNAIQSIGSMRDDAGIALFGPEKWSKLQSFKTLHGAIKPYLEFGANPNTGARVQQAHAKELIGDTGAAVGAMATAAGHGVPAAIGLVAKGLNKIGVNKMKASMMADPASFKSANAQSMLTPKAKKVYKTIMSGSVNQLANAYNQQGKQ